MSDSDFISIVNTNMGMHDISPGGKGYQSFACLQRQRKRMPSSVTPRQSRAIDA